MTAISSNTSAASAYPTNSADTAPMEDTSAAAATEGTEQATATTAAATQAAEQDAFENASPAPTDILGTQVASEDAVDLAANSEFSSFQINPATGMPNQSIQMLDTSASAQSDQGSVDANAQADLEVQDNSAGPDSIEGASVSGQVNAERQVGEAQVTATASATATTNGKVDAEAQIDVHTDRTHAAVYGATDGESAEVVAAAQYDGDNVDVAGGIRADTDGNIEGEIRGDINGADGALTGEFQGEFDNSGASGEVTMDYDGENLDAHLYAQGDTRDGTYDVEADFQAQNDDGSLRAEGTFRADEEGYAAQVDATYENGNAQYSAGGRVSNDGAEAYAAARVEGDRFSAEGAAVVDQDGATLTGTISAENAAGTRSIEAEVQADLPFGDARPSVEGSVTATQRLTDNLDLVVEGSVDGQETAATAGVTFVPGRRRRER